MHTFGVRGEGKETRWYNFCPFYICTLEIHKVIDKQMSHLDCLTNGNKS